MEALEPVIGVTASDESRAKPFAEAVRRGGGQPLVILPTPAGSVQSVVNQISGLVITGCELTDSADSFETLLLEGALEADMPVLCLSQGFWVFNSVLGGREPKETLMHEAQGHESERESSYHRIFITPGSKLAAVVGSGGFVRVNSRHAMGLREAQKSSALLASAYSLDDGVIEALESPYHRWAFGVQFNPERINELPPHFLRLFQSMADRAKEYQNGGENG